MEQLLEKIESMKVLEVKPDDVLVITIKSRLSTDQVQRFKGSVISALKLPEDISVVILEDGADIGVLRKG